MEVDQGMGMPTCAVCKSQYPIETTTCPKDGTKLQDPGAQIDPSLDDPSASTLEEGLTVDALKEGFSTEENLGRTLTAEAQAPAREEKPGKLSAAIKVSTSLQMEVLRQEELPETPTRKKTGPVVVIRSSNEDSNELIKASTAFAQRDPRLEGLSVPEAPVQLSAKSVAEVLATPANEPKDKKPNESEDPSVQTLEEPISPFDRYIGAVISNHRVEKKLGQGGMGAVYSASHFTLGRQIAIKILNQQFVSKQDVVRRFFDEARAANKIRHPNIIEVYDVGILPDRAAYLTMELLNGRDLKSILKERGALSPKEVQSLFVPVCEALQAAHDVGIIHRDLKPENIFICQENGQTFPKIVDFGIAKLNDNNLDVQLRTRTGMVMGTPAYMSPEQAAGQKSLDARADIYSVGVILYECLTGHPPFTGESVAAILIKQVTEQPQLLRNVVPEKHIPPKLNDLVHHCLEKDPNDRPASMSELVSALKDPETFVPSGVVQAVSKPAQEAPPPKDEQAKEITKITRLKEPEDVELSPKKNYTWLWGLGGAAFTALLFLVVWNILTPERPKTKPSSSQEVDIPSLQFAPPMPKGFLRKGEEIPLSSKK